MRTKNGLRLIKSIAIALGLFFLWFVVGAFLGRHFGHLIFSDGQLNELFSTMGVPDNIEAYTSVHALALLVVVGGILYGLMMLAYFAVQRQRGSASALVSALFSLLVVVFYVFMFSGDLPS